MDAIAYLNDFELNRYDSLAASSYLENDEYDEYMKLSSMAQNRKKFASNATDNKYAKMKMTIWAGNRKQNVFVEKYGSGGQGSQIRNAVTGQRYQHIVGSADEDFYFKVADTTSAIPLTLFYETPEEYEQHQYTRVSDSVKENWRKKAFVN
jgi:hypothetical protein